MEDKAKLESRRKAAEEVALQKESLRDRKIRAIGNYVHDSVPVSNNEVSGAFGKGLRIVDDTDRVL